MRQRFMRQTHNVGHVSLLRALPMHLVLTEASSTLRTKSHMRCNRFELPLPEIRERVVKRYHPQVAEGFRWRNFVIVLMLRSFGKEWGL